MTVEKSDSGNYTCSTTHAEPSTISVFVSEGISFFFVNKINGDKQKSICFYNDFEKYKRVASTS